MGIAEQCPYTNGPAVFSARGMLGLFNNSLYFDDELLCSFPAPRQQTNVLNNSVAISVFPNPAKDEIIVKHNGIETSADFILVDLVGKEVLRKLIHSEKEKLTIDVSSLTPRCLFLFG